MKLRRRVVAAMAAVFALTIVVAVPAYAQEGDTGTETEAEGEGPKGHAEEECIHILEGGGEIDECQESPNPILPAANELIWGSISFFVVFGLLAKFAFPAMKKAVVAREDRIRADLEAAERSRTEAEGVRSQYDAQLADARAEAGRIIEEARQAGEGVRRDVVARAEQEANDLRARAQADIAAQRERVLAELRGEIGAMSIDLAGRIVERNLDTETNRQLVDTFIDQVGRSN